MKLFGFEIIVRRLPKAQSEPELPHQLTPEQSRSGWDMVRNGVPVLDEELERAKPVTDAGLRMICTRCGRAPQRLYFTPGWEGSVCAECRAIVNPSSKFLPDLPER
jgi:hypothetical protein